MLVKVDKEEAKSIGGVLLPATARNKPTAGAVIALGEASTVKVCYNAALSAGVGQVSASRSACVLAGKGHQATRRLSTQRHTCLPRPPTSTPWKLTH